MHAVAICAFKGYRAFTSFRLKTILITDKANVVDIPVTAVNITLSYEHDEI